MASVRLLAVDPGVKCGYAFMEVHQPLADGIKADYKQAGVWLLQTKRYEGYGMRFVRLHNLLEEMNPDMIAYEQVNFPHKSTAAAEAYYGIVGKVKEFGDLTGAVYCGITTTDVKTRATGKGGGKGTDKTHMVNAANAFFEIDPPLNNSKSASNPDHNTADALWIMQIMLENYASGASKRNQRKDRNEQR